MAKAILIVEDDNFLQGLESKKLKNEGYEVFAAANNEEAFNIINSKAKFDLILLDLLLPGVDGFDILRKIRNDKTLQSMPVIVFSNLSEEKDVERAKTLGISEFMVKSNFTLDELTEKVRGLIGR